MTYNIFTPSVTAVLQLMEASTGHPYYVNELADKTGFSKQQMISVVAYLHERGVVDKKPEFVDEYTNRGARNYITLTPFGLSACRLTPLST